MYKECTLSCSLLWEILLEMNSDNKRNSKNYFRNKSCRLLRKTVPNIYVSHKPLKNIEQRIYKTGPEKGKVYLIIEIVYPTHS